MTPLECWKCFVFCLTVSGPAPALPAQWPGCELWDAWPQCVAVGDQCLSGDGVIDLKDIAVVLNEWSETMIAFDPSHRTAGFTPFPMPKPAVVSTPPNDTVGGKDSP